VRKSLILVVDDEAPILRLLRATLQADGYGVITATNGQEAVEVQEREQPDLIVLDMMMPIMDGTEALKRIRRESNVPIIFLTARTGSSDKIRTLDLGADDYVTKPFGVLELVARVEAVLRRASASSSPKAPPSDASRFGDIEIQPVARVVRKNGRPVELSPKEYELLLALVQRPGQVISRAELLKTVWGYHASVVSRTIDTHIAELRRKLEPNPASPRHITTVWKTGYRFLP
jgi:DNA-binding response OmpR family regulator